MLTLSNVGHSGGILTFRATWDSNVLHPVRTVSVVATHITQAKGIINCTEVARGANYVDLQATVPISNNIVDVIAGTHCYEKFGFFLRVYTSDKRVALCERHLERGYSVDPIGTYQFQNTYVPDLGMANTYLGWSFLNGSTVYPADATNLYCDDVYPEANILNSVGAVDNPIYSPLEAVQLAGLISRAYSHAVTVWVAPGDYELMRIEHFMAEAATVTVKPTDITNLPKIYTNEDLNNSTLFLGGGYPLGYHNTYLDGYNDWAFRVTGNLYVEDLDLSKVNVQGMASTLSFKRTSVAMASINVRVIDAFVWEDCQDSAVLLSVTAPVNTRWRWDKGMGSYDGKVTGFIDPAWESTKWPMFKRSTHLSQAEMTAAMSANTTALALALGYPFGETFPLASLNNYHDAQWAFTEGVGYADISGIDAYTDVDEAIFSNPNTLNWDSNDLTVTFLRSQFRDSSDVYVNAGYGFISAKNSVFTDHCTFMYGKGFLSKNNEFSQNHWLVRYGCSSHVARAEIHQHFPCNDTVIATDIIGVSPSHYWLDKRFNQSPTLEQNCAIGARPAGNYQTSQTLDLAGVTAVSRAGLARSVLTLMYGITSAEATITADYPYTARAYQDFSDVSSYNPTFDLANYYDAISLRPLPASSLIDAGNPDIGDNDLDGSRNDVGHFGGPDADTNLLARIYWLDSFTTVNNSGVYEGMNLSLIGDRSAWSAAITPAFTWSATLDASPWTPAGGWVDNGTLAGANQAIVLGGAGTYIFTLLVADGLGGTSQTTATFNVTTARVFCVDPDKTFTNNVLPAPVGPAEEVDLWTHVTQTVGFVPATVSKPFDGVALDCFPVDKISYKAMTLTANTRYYLKLSIGRENLSQYKANSTTRFSVFIVDSDNKLLFGDRGEMKATDFMTVNTFDDSITHGTATAYFRTSTATSATIYVIAEHAAAEMTYLRHLWIAPADEEIDAIYQDLRLAVRHHNVGDEVHVAGSVTGKFVDVPIRVAGKKIYFNIKGGYDSASHDGTDYVTRNWATYKTHLNYLRFAWFARQRDWAYNAISMYATIYMESELTGFYVENTNLDTPNAYGYDGVSVNLITHKKVKIGDIAISGLYKAGNINVYGDELLTGQELDVDGIDVSNCAIGLNVATRYTDTEVHNCGVSDMPTAGIVVATMEGANIKRTLLVHDNILDDVGCGEIVDFTATFANDPIARTMQTPKFGSGGADQYYFDPFTTTFFGPVYAPMNAQIVLSTGFWDYTAGQSMGKVKIYNNIFRATHSKKAIHAVAHAGPGTVRQLEIYGNTCTGVKRGLLAFTSCPYLRPKIYIGNGMTQRTNPLTRGNYATTADFVAYLNANDLPFYAVYDNIVTGVGAVVDYVTKVPHPYHGFDVVVEGNTLTTVSTLIHWGPMTFQSPQSFHKVENFYHLTGNSAVQDGVPNRFFWGLHKANPELSGYMLTDILTYGDLPLSMRA